MENYALKFHRPLKMVYLNSFDVHIYIKYKYIKIYV